MRGVRVIRVVPGATPGGADAAAPPPRGLPWSLPRDETLLWQGSPAWGGVFRRALHGRAIMLYFAALLAWCAVETVARHTPHLWASMAVLAVLAAVATGLVALFAAMVARTTVYTVTDRRVVLTIGVALSASINLPFAAIESAALRLHKDGSGDIPLRLAGPTRLGVVQLWPHVRPWRLRAVEPMLRAVPDAARVGRLLAASLAASAGQPVAAALSGAGAAGSRIETAPVPVFEEQAA